MCQKRSEYDGYVFSNGSVMKREEGKTPNGNVISGRWVLRDEKGNWVDFDRYRSDLAERNFLDLEAEDVIKPNDS